MRSLPTFVSAVSVLCLSFVATAAHAQGDAVAGTGFGQPGQFVFDANFGASVDHHIESAVDSGSQMRAKISETNLVLTPTLLYFLVPDLAVGGLLGFTYTSSDNFSSRALVIGPAIGVNFDIADRLTFFPSASVWYAHVRQELSGQAASGYQIGFDVTAPLLYHPVPHLFFGAGPSFSQGLASKVGGDEAPKTTDFGVALLIGGWL